MPSATARTEPASGVRVRSVTPCMGTLAVIDIWGRDAAPAAALVRSELERLEALWSRFRVGSDVSRLNAAAGAWVELAPETVALLRRALALTAETGGAFDITLGGGAASAIDSRDDAARLRRGARVDLGGIGKGAAVERVVRLLEEQRVPAAMVNLGRSSIGVAGRPPGRDQWRVELSAAPGSAVTFRDGCLSTSADDGPGAGGTVDPRTGETPRCGVRSATVWCDDGARAEAWSTALLVLGLPGLERAGLAGCRAILVDDAGSLHASVGMRGTEGEASCA